VRSRRSAGRDPASLLGRYFHQSHEAGTVGYELRVAAVDPSENILRTLLVNDGGLPRREPIKLQFTAGIVRDGGVIRGATSELKLKPKTMNLCRY